MGEAIQALEAYEVLREKLGDEATKKLIAYVDEKVKGEVATKADLELAKGELRAEIEKVKADLIKWMFLFWIGQVVSIVGILKIAGVF